MEEKRPPEQWADTLVNQPFRRGYLLLQAASALTQPFRRIRGGRNSPGKAGALAFAALLFWLIQTRDYWVLRYLQLWVGSLVAYRMTMDRSAHSESEGDPWFTMLLTKNWAIASALEPILAIGIGCLLWEIRPAIALILLTSGAGMAINEIVDWHIRLRTKIVHDDAQHVMRQQRDIVQRRS